MYTSRRQLLLAFLIVCTLGAAAADADAAVLHDGVTLTTVDAEAFGKNDINVVANARNSVVRHGKYQYVAYYRRDPAAAADATHPYAVYVARRDTTDPASKFVPIKLAVSQLTNARVADDHCSISIAVDNGGFLHVSYGMHGHGMRYRISNRVATATTWQPFSAFYVYTNFTDFDGHTTGITYPEFTRVPGANDLLYTFRQGGSGSGDIYATRVTSTGTPAAPNFTFSTPMPKLISGTAPGTTNAVSAYTNNLVYAKNGELMMSWVWRETPGYQSNHDIMFAKSRDHGESWTDISGAPLAAPFSVYNANTNPTGTPAAIPIPAGSSLINTTTMAVDSQDRPMVATWYAPGAAQGNHVRQYMLEYWDGDQWLHSQITNRTAEAIYGGDGTPTTTEPTTDHDVRELGRPLILVDNQDRVLVLMRYRNDAGGADPYAGNQLVVAHSADRRHWDFLTLVADDLGNFEPASYDRDLWASENKLSLLYQRTGWDRATSPISLLEWDAAAYFASVPEPGAAVALLPVAVSAVLRRPRRRSIYSHSEWAAKYAKCG